jgi:magnesium-transporting ATPase (P-type)
MLYLRAHISVEISAEQKLSKLIIASIFFKSTFSGQTALFNEKAIFSYIFLFFIFIFIFYFFLFNVLAFYRKNQVKNKKPPVINTEG